MRPTPLQFTLLASLTIVVALPAHAQLGQSDWQSGGGVSNSRQNQSQSSLGQSDWVSPGNSGGGGLGQSDWVSPGGSSAQSSGLGQSGWVQSNYSQSSSQGMGQSDWQQPGAAPQDSFQEQPISNSKTKLVGEVLDEEQSSPQGSVNIPGVGLAPGFTAPAQTAAVAVIEPATQVAAVPQTPAAPAGGTAQALGTLMGANNPQAQALQQLAPAALNFLMNVMPPGGMRGGMGGFPTPGSGYAGGIGGGGTSSGGYNNGYRQGAAMTNRVVRQTTNQAASRLNSGLSRMINQIGR